MNGKHAFYTRPQDGFIEVEAGEGIGWTFVEDIIHAEAHDEIIIDQKIYHTIKELNNGLGPAPIKTEKGRQHLAHGLRSCASELQYVLYLFMTDLADPSKVINFPFGYLWRRRAKKELMIFQMFCSQMDG
jgi:4-O-beta-D-mannosyl-D-glucose phosphorylase